MRELHRFDAQMLQMHILEMVPTTQTHVVTTASRQLIVEVKMLHVWSNKRYKNFKKLNV